MSEKENSKIEFGAMLKKFRARGGLTPSDMASELSISLDQYIDIEAGNIFPDANIVINVSSILNLSTENANNIASAYLETKKSLGLVSPHRMSRIMNSNTMKSAEQLQSQIEEIQGSIKRLDVLVRNKDSEQNNTSNFDEKFKLLNDLALKVSEIQDTGRRLTAQVLLPPDEEMAVQLVKTDSLERLEEYREDQNRAWALIGLFMGGAMGIAGNWLTGAEINRAGIIVLIL